MTYLTATTLLFVVLVERNILDPMTPNPPRRLSEAIAGSFLTIFTWSYSGAYAYHTVKPIEAIRESQHDTTKLIRALAHFRNTKNEELIFVSRAVSP